MRVDEYIAAVEGLAREGRPGPLKKVIDARVRGCQNAVTVTVNGTTEQIISPSLERDDLDPNSVFHTVFLKLRNASELEGLDILHRAASELYVQGLNNGADMEYLNAVARLVGHVRVSQSVELRPLLEQQLFGFLDSSPPRPFEELIELDGKWLERATLALDSLVAVLPVEPSCPKHYWMRFDALLEHSHERLKRGSLIAEPRLRLLFLVFRALVKVHPSIAASRWLRPMCRLIDRLDDEVPRARRRWLSLCRHQGVVFANHPERRQRFLEGVEKIQLDQGFLRDSRGDALFQETLQKLDNLWVEVEPRWRRRKPRTHRVSFERPSASSPSKEASGARP